MVADETFKLRLEGNSVTSASLAKVAPIYVRMDFLRSTGMLESAIAATIWLNSFYPHFNFLASRHSTKGSGRANSRCEGDACAVGRSLRDCPTVNRTELIKRCESCLPVYRQFFNLSSFSRVTDSGSLGWIEGGLIAKRQFF
jgi:hypothetical protein